MTEHNDLQHKLVNDVYAELGTISKHSQDVIDYLMRHGWIRTPGEAEAAARGGKVQRSGKYADLIQAIEDSDSMTGCERATVEAVLDWFDRNLDQTPRLTITDSQLKAMAGQLFYRWSDLDTMTDKLADELDEVGVTVGPAPEPTNVEKLQAIMADVAVKEVGFSVIPKAFAEFLDRRGVKAPGGDDDH